MSAFTNKNDRAMGRTKFGIVQAYQGRLRDAIKLIESGVSADRMEQHEGYNSVVKLAMLSFLNLEVGEFEEAWEAVNQSMSLLQRLAPNQTFGFAPLFTKIAVTAGHAEKLDSLLHDFGLDSTQTGSDRSDSYWECMAIIALSNNSPKLALDHAKRISSLDPGGEDAWNHFLLGEIYLALRQPAEAIQHIENVAHRYSIPHFHDVPQTVKSHYLLGQAYEMSGWNDKAIEAYEAFLGIWHDPDPEIEEIADAKARIAALKQGTS